MPIKLICTLYQYANFTVCYNCLVKKKEEEKPKTARLPARFLYHKYEVLKNILTMIPIYYKVLRYSVDV